MRRFSEFPHFCSILICNLFYVDMKKNWIYYGIFFSDSTKNTILSYVKRWFEANGREFPEDWKIYCDHMTLVFNDGSKEAQKFANGVEPFLGDFASLRSTAIGISDRAIALEVDYITNNKHSHITVAIVPDGKPVESNDIEEWIPTTESLYVTGIYKKVS